MASAKGRVEVVKERLRQRRGRAQSRTAARGRSAVGGAACDRGWATAAPGAARGRREAARVPRLSRGESAPGPAADETPGACRPAMPGGPSARDQPNAAWEVRGGQLTVNWGAGTHGSVTVTFALPAAAACGRGGGGGAFAGGGGGGGGGCCCGCCGCCGCGGGGGGGGGGFILQECEREGVADDKRGCAAAFASVRGTSENFQVWMQKWNLD